ncbi:MAG: DMT family transporter [Kiloniellales bacterium]
MSQQSSGARQAPAPTADRKPGHAEAVTPAQRRIAVVLLFVAPALFAANMLTARATHELVPPVALAFWRWAATLALLLPFVGATLWRQRDLVLREWKDLLLLGALGMGICGAFVYIGADTTTATNIGLIYAASPILIVLIARCGYGEPFGARQGLGIALCLVGVVAIVCRGEPAMLRALAFVPGDIWILAATISWALYSVLLRHRESALGAMTRFAAIVLGGLVVLAPFHLGEALAGDIPQLTPETVAAVAFLALVASFGAYQVYALIQRRLGAGTTALLMYLIPLYNGLLAWLLLGERIEAYHLAGAALLLPGIWLATRRG